jgi:Ni/Fe-hydrogenase subunit HybB-like protein
MRGYADRPSVKAPNWHGLVVADILFNNLCTGLFLVAALAELAAPAKFAAVARIAFPVALGLLVLDLVCLVLDLGDPLRFHHMLRVFKVRSPMSVGTWSLVAFSLPLGLLGMMTILGFGPGWDGVRHALAAVALVPALVAAMYKGVLFSTTAQPGWRDARWLGGYLATSAVLLGCAQLLLLALLLDQPAAIAMLRTATLALLVVNGIGLALVVKDVPRLRTAGAVAGAVGMAAPLALLSWSGPAPFAAAAVLIVAGALVIRRALVRLPHH